MPKKHQVKQGDCLLSLARNAGIFHSRIATHPDNRELMAKRPDPNLLLPGDKLTIPDKEFKEETGETEKRHKFKKLVEQAVIRINIYELGLPRKNEPYYVEINNKRLPCEKDRTDDEGLVVCRIPADAQTATVVLGETKDRYELALGHVDPPDTVSGVHSRLANLGYYQGAVDKEYDGESINAMAAFLSHRGRAELNCTKCDDPDILDELIETNGS